MITPLIAMPGGWELIIIVLVIVLLFGARKLPELARGTGQALRIFKAETKGLSGEDDDRSSDEGSSSDSSSSTDESGGTASETKPSQSDGNGR